MAGSYSNYAEDKIVDHAMGVSSFTMPTVYVALCTADPTDAGTGASMNEVSNAGSYARVAVAPDFGTPSSGGSIANDGIISFVEATGSWGTITHFALLDSGTHGAGNMIAHGDLSTSKAVTSGDTVQIPIGDLTVTLT